MGIVFLLPEAKDDNGNDVVVKVFRREKWKRQNDYERFRDEVFFVRRIVEQERLSGVSIPLVVPDSYYHLPKTDSARNEGKEVCQWFAMPKMEPYDFSVKRTLLDKIGLLLQVWESLSFIHSHNGAHRDIKAKNILFDRKNNRWVLSDYGLIHFDRPGGQLTKTGDHLKIYGGPRELQSFNEYKKYENRTDLFQKSDVYLFGKLCWQILANKELFFEGPFSYNSVHFKRLIEELSFSQVPFSPMMRIFQKAILDEPDDRCDLE